MKSTKGFSVSDWCRNFEISFQGEQGMFLTEYGNISCYWKKYIIIRFNISFQALIGAVFDESGSN